jgi:uncharacterized membrane protein
MMLVHFPIAFLPMSAGFDIAGIYFNNENLALFSFFCGVAGVALGLLALLFGAGDLLKIETKSKAFTKALLHGGLNLTWLLVFSVIVGIDFKTYPQINLPSIGEILIKICVVIGMLYSNFLGGELVLKFDIGKPSASDK